MSDKDFDRRHEIEERAKEYQRSFSYERFRVIRKELFAHLRDPALTIRTDGIIFNAACISKLEDVVYIKILIDYEDRQIAIKQCDENDRNALRWCNLKNDGTRRSRKITGRSFSDMVYGMMDWSKAKRYKIMGYLLEIEHEKVFLFDLNMPEKFDMTSKKKKKTVKEATLDASVDNSANDKNNGFSEQKLSFPTENTDIPKEKVSSYGETVMEDEARQNRRSLDGFEAIKPSREDEY